LNDYTGDAREGVQTLTLLLVSTLTVMAGATIAPALPGMRDQFAGTPGAEFLTKLVLTSPALSIAVCGSFVGWLIDRRGRKMVLLWSTVLYAFAGTSGLYLDSLHGVLAGRLLLGIAVAGTMTASTTLIGDYYRGAARNRVVGFQAAAMNLGGVVFVTLGGYLAAWHWRAPFLVYGAALVLIPLAATVLTEPARRSTDAVGAPAPQPSGVLRLLFFLYTVVFLMQIAFFMVPVQLPFYLERIGETGPTRVGAAIALMTVCSGSTAVSFKLIASRFDKLFILGLSFALMGIGYVFLSKVTNFGQVAASIMIFGLGLGMTFPNFVGWLMSGTPAGIRGRVVGGMMTVGFAGQFLSPIALHPLIAKVDLDGAFRVVGIAMIAGAAAALAAPAVKRVSRIG
jgi:MFS family permease